MMGINASGLFVVLLLALAGVIVVVALVMAFVRRGPKAVSAPVCGACGYHLAPNPAGLTVCPECGGDFLQVGILAPGMKLGRRGSPAVPLAVAWFILVGVGMVPVHGQLARAFTKMVNTGRATVTSTGKGPVSVSAAAVREQVAGAPAPDSLEADVTLTAPDGKETVFKVDGKTKTISEAPTASGLKGTPWDLAAAKKMVTATGTKDDANDESAENIKASVDEALSKSAGIGGVSVLNSFTSSSSSGITGFGSRSRQRAMASSSSSYSGTSAPAVIIGPLRGAYWVTLITGLAGLLLAMVGLGAILAFTREKRKG